MVIGRRLSLLTQRNQAKPIWTTASAAGKPDSAHPKPSPPRPINSPALSGTSSSISLLTILRSGPRLRKKSGRKSSNGSNKMLSPSATNSSAHQQLKHLVTHEATKQPSMGKTQNKSYCSRLRSESNLDRWNKNLEKHHCVHRRFQVIQANMVKD